MTDPWEWFIKMSDKSKEISYYAFETRINQNVLNLLKPSDEQKIKDQE